MQQEVKVSFYLKKNETKEDGKCPVMARLSIGKYSEITFSMKMTVPVSLWASGRATGKSLAAIEINRQLDEIRASALSHYRELSAVRENVTADDVKNVLLGMAFGQETLLAYFRTHNENFDKRVGVNRKEGSAKAYRYALGHLTRFVKAKYKLSDIPFTALDRSFIDKYDLFLRTDRGLMQKSVHQQLYNLKKMTKRAISQGTLRRDPYHNIYPELPPLRSRHLKPEELERLM